MTPRTPVVTRVRPRVAIPNLPRVPERARRAWSELSAALASPDARVPCTTVLAPWWTSEDQAERAAAAEACIGCTALIACSTYADLARLTTDVYGGADRTPAVPTKGTTA